MRNYIGHLLTALFTVSASVLLTTSCSEWTETESLDIHQPTLEEQNPELYAKYIAALKDYKASEHKVVFVKFENKATAPAGRAEHISCLPDSIDFVVLNNPDNLSSAVQRDMLKIRNDKGTRTIYAVDYSIIEKEWKVIQDQETPEQEQTPAQLSEEEGGEGDAETLDPFLAFCAERTNHYLSLCDKYGYDGVTVVYNGKSPSSMNAEVKAQVKAYQGAFFEAVTIWADAHPSKLLIFEGKPQNILYDKPLAARCAYILIPSLGATSKSALTQNVQDALVGNGPSDRFVVCITIPSIIDKMDTKGFFVGVEADGTPIRATKAAAEWANESAADFGKAGISIAQAQNDYYNITKIYKHIRESVSIMNPTPNNQ